MSTERRDSGIGRRSFLKGAAAVSTVLATATNAAAAEEGKAAAPEGAANLAGGKFVTRPGSDFMVDVIRSLQHHQMLGSSGGAGVGYGAPAAVGVALANRERGILTVNIQADGDLLYALSVLWTAGSTDRLQIIRSVPIQDRRRYTGRCRKY